MVKEKRFPGLTDQPAADSRAIDTARRLYAWRMQGSLMTNVE
jgi:hypothetical protein